MGFFEAMAAAIVVGKMYIAPEIVQMDYLMPNGTVMTVEALAQEVDTPPN